MMNLFQVRDRQNNSKSKNDEIVLSPRMMENLPSPGFCWIILSPEISDEKFAKSQNLWRK